MAEFCYKCLKKEFDIDEQKEKVILSKDTSWCEGCGEHKHIVLKIKKKNNFIFSLLRRK